MPFLDCPDGLRLHYQLHGNGPEKVLLIMGLLTDLQAWSPLMDVLRRWPEYEFCIYDNRGVGKSSAPFARYTTCMFAKDAKLLMDHLNWASCHVVGISMGGMISQELALLAPERLRSLSLLVTHAGGLRSASIWKGVSLLLRSTFTSNVEDRTRIALDLLYSRATLASPAERARLYQFHLNRNKQRVPPPLMGLLGHYAAVLTHHCSFERLQKIRHAGIGTLVLVTDEDLLVRPQNSHYLKEATQAHFKFLPDSGHNVIAEKPEEVAQALVAHFSHYGHHKANVSPDLSYETTQPTKVVHRPLHVLCHHQHPCAYRSLTAFFYGYVVCFCLRPLLSLLTTSPILSDSSSNFAWLGGSLYGLYRALSCLRQGIHTIRHIKDHNHEHAGWIDFPFGSAVLAVCYMISMYRILRPIL
eukprot:TRINITY_DN6191_c0_g1_i10.p1 TRINITY_DN6191_c0_g1~~TRINITY_DN6191_c0_g1_i10.p1  ORF type:complete len:414 (+),score=49.73 TRINITY_DN6191_c0_g1_i10:61-1302(+)